MICRSRSIWAILALVLFVGTTGAFAQALLDPTTLTKYIDPLLQPPVRTQSGTKNGYPLFDVHVREAKQKMHSQLDSTTVFTFDGATPGATFLVQTDNPVYVRYINDLPVHHMLAVDTTIAVMAGMSYGDTSRFVSHLHGGDVPAWSDGFCTASINPGQETTYYYPNSQQAATLWYHDHSCGITRLNAYAGIAGFYIIIDPYERSLNMPEGAYELGIAVQDRQFYDNGQLYYPPTWVPEHFGDVALVNGTIWPKLEVEPRKYRIHLLDGCNDRFLSMKLLKCDSLGNVAADSAGGPPFYMVGTEQGLVSRTVVLNDTTDPFPTRLIIGPGDRRDLIIDFAGQQGQYLLMHNNASAPFDGTFPPNPENPLPELFLVHVKDTTVTDQYDIPFTPRRQPTYDTLAAAVHRNIIMEEVHDSMGNPMKVMLNGKGFMEPTTEFPELGTSEVWNYVNTTVDMHPMHSHLINFQVFEKQPFNVDHYFSTGEIVYTGPPELPEAQEIGRRDMVYTPPGYVTRVVTSPYNRLGTYVYHCHILSHEENDMMRPFEVVEPPTVTVISPSAGDVWNVGKPAMITCTHGGGVALTDSIDLTTDGGTTWTFLLKEAAADTHNVPSVPNTPSTAACVRITTTGISGLTGQGDCPTDFIIALRDAGVSQILFPADGQVFGTTNVITPQARVNNYGTIDEPDVPAWFMFAGYADTQHVAVTMAAGSVDRNFTGTTPAPGYYTANSATSLPFDFVPGNDAAAPISFLVMDAPSDLTPEGGMWVSSSPLLDWADLAGVAGADGYHIQVATDAGFTSVVLDQTSTASELATSLPDADDYYWRVQGVNVLSGPWSSTAHFRLDTGTPSGPALVAPTPWQQDVSNMPMFDWTDVTFAGGKSSRVSPTIGTNNRPGTSLFGTTNNGSVLAPKGSKDASGMTYDLRAANDIDFTNNIANRPGTYLSGMTGNGSAPTTRGSKDASGITYHLRVATDIGFTNVVISADPTMSTYTPDTPLDDGITYYWRVNASDEAGNLSSWGGPDSFATAAVPAVQLVSPNGGEIWNVGQPATITCTHAGGTAVTDSIDLTTDGGSTWTFLLKEASADTHVVASVPNMPTTAACVQITVIGPTGLTDDDDCDEDFTIALRDAGVSQILFPADGEVFGTTDTITPMARVNNYGTIDEPNVPTTFTFAGYSDTEDPEVPVDPGVVDEEFAGTTPEAGYYTAHCVTSLPADFVPGNNAAVTISFLVMDQPDELTPDSSEWLSRSPLLDWARLPGIANRDGYHIQVATDSGFLNIVLDTTSSQSQFRTSLPDADDYYWRVQGVNILSGPWSETAHFRLDAGVPEAPGLVTPTPWEQDVPTMPVFDWTEVTFAAGKATGVSPAIGTGKQLHMSLSGMMHGGLSLAPRGGKDASGITYHLEVANDINFNDIVISADTTASTYTPTTPLDNEAQYYWRVDASDEAGNLSDWGGPDSFVTVEAAPAGFELLSPADSAEDQPIRGNLIWQSSEGADSFAIYFDTNNPPTTLLRRVAGNVPTTPYTGVANETYYWTVVAENSGGTTTASNAPWSFSTIELGVEEGSATNGAPFMSVGPNPLTTGHATLRYCLPRAGTASICVVDITGRTVMTQAIATGRTGSTALDLHDLAAGVYLAKLQASGFATTQRFVVEK